MYKYKSLKKNFLQLPCCLKVNMETRPQPRKKTIKQL